MFKERKLPEQPQGTTYASAGVDISKAEQAVRAMRPHCESTHDGYVLGGIGPFAAALDLGGLLRDWQMKDPVELFTTDGPGTIPLIAQMVRDGMDKSFVPLGYNVAAHCFSDLACGGGRPIAFLDSISSTDVDVSIHEEIVQGMAEACREVGARFLGGETAQLPGMLISGVTNFEGFAAALVERQDWIQPLERIMPYMPVIGIEARFPHLNGISLARKICFETLGLKATDILEPTDKSVAESLIQRQPIYSKVVQAQMKEGLFICGASHITGGGLYDNIARNLPEGRQVVLHADFWEIPPLFKWLCKQGNVVKAEAFKTWNMGIGFAEIFETEEIAKEAIKLVQDQFGLKACVIGDVVPGRALVDIRF